MNQINNIISYFKMIFSSFICSKKKKKKIDSTEIEFNITGNLFINR